AAVAAPERPPAASADGEVVVPRHIRPREPLPARERLLQRPEDFRIEGDHPRPLVAPHAVAAGTVWVDRRRQEQGEVEQLGPGRLGSLDSPEQLDPPYDIVEAPIAQRRQNLPDLRGDQREVRDDLLRRAAELAAARRAPM